MDHGPEGEQDRLGDLLDLSDLSAPKPVPPPPQPSSWLCVIDYLIFADEESNMFEVEALGVFWGFAQATSTRILATLTDPQIEQYELLLEFASAEKKEAFLRLMEGNELTEGTDEYIVIPSNAQIAAARPLEEVFDRKILNEARTIAAQIVQSVIGAQ